jgi:hypothetical protein
VFISSIEVIYLRLHFAPISFNSTDFIYIFKKFSLKLVVCNCLHVHHIFASTSLTVLGKIITVGRKRNKLAGKTESCNKDQHYKSHITDGSILIYYSSQMYIVSIVPHKGDEHFSCSDSDMQDWSQAKPLHLEL